MNRMGVGDIPRSIRMVGEEEEETICQCSLSDMLSVPMTVGRCIASGASSLGMGNRGGREERRE